jgi:hypothetical protein
VHRIVVARSDAETVRVRIGDVGLVLGVEQALQLANELAGAVWDHAVAAAP